MPPDPATWPLFPLGTVLVPGLVLPLVLFEPRYLDLARDLLDRPEGERAFIVVAIRDGQEVGAEGIRSLHEVGTVAEVRDITPLPDGRFEIVTVGAQRMRLGDLTGSAAYLTVTATEVPEAPGPDPQAAAARVRQRFTEYRMLLGGEPEEGTGAVDAEVPDDPRVLSYLVTTAMVLDLPDRQRLLEVPDDTTRLNDAHRLLSREIAVIRGLPSLPATDLARLRPSPN